MSPVRPQDNVVPDLSRFEYGRLVPRLRSRNTTPTSPATPQINLAVPPRLSPKESEADYAHRDDIFNYYSKPSELVVNFQPYPPDVQSMKPPLPPKPNVEQYFEKSPQQVYDLPPVQDSRDYAAGVQRIPQREGIFMERVMNKPLLRFGSSSPFEDTNQYNVTAHTLLEIAEIVFSIIVIIVASTLGTLDHHTSIALYRYFIASGVVSLIVALLFVTKTINYERRNGVFYSVVITVLTGVAFVLALCTIIPAKCQGSTCAARRALAAFAILSFLLWLVSLVMYFTALYISKMEHVEPQAPPVPQYVLTDAGEMYPVSSTHDVRDKRKMIVYAQP